MVPIIADFLSSTPSVSHVPKRASELSDSDASPELASQWEELLLTSGEQWMQAGRGVGIPPGAREAHLSGL